MDKELLQTILDTHVKFKNSYFWTSPGNASSRRSLERQNSNEIDFHHNGHHYKIYQSVSCSCRNVYYHLCVYVDGVKKDVRAIKKIIRES